MKLKAYQLDDSIAKAGKSVFAFLFYGADLGAIRHGADQVISFIKRQDTQADVIILTAESLKENPYRLNEEGASNSLFASKRILWLKNPPDNLLDQLDAYISNANSDTPVLIITSDSFNTKSKTVTLINDLPNACALGFYLEEGAQLRQTISQTLQNNGFTILPEALSFLMESLGADKGATLSELDKLMLYKGDDKKITLDDVMACFAGFAPTSMEELLMSALSGDAMLAQKKMMLLLEEGTSCVAIIRSFLLKINQLLRVQAWMEAGLKADEAIKKTPPFISFKYADLWKKIVLSWPVNFTVEAQKMTIEAEKNSKSGLPDELVLTRFLASLCQGGKKFCR
ncbi:MAG: DNA polymerase III subunit delta [Alphaproteobacteria bacterium]|nr:DNA polymerase III subunit delta [Alphaproteobacteria bacterium]